MSFDKIVALDVTLMILFVIFVVVFLRKRWKNVHKEGLMFLYKTKIGLKFIDWAAKKYKKVLTPLQYVIIGVGYILMIAVVYMMATTVYLYIKYPLITKIVSAPPIMPIFPYFTKFFGLKSFFPEFQFVPFMVALIIVMAVHEFAHGILARLNNIRIKSTGFAFFLIFPGAFVEQDDKDMNKASKFAQLSVLAAGVFANVVTAILFLGLLWALFLGTFNPGGVMVTDYAMDVINTTDAKVNDNFPIDDFEKTLDEKGLVRISSKNNEYYTNRKALESALEQGVPAIQAYVKSAALDNQILSSLEKTYIYRINQDYVNSMDDLSDALDKYSPGDNVDVYLLWGDEEVVYNVELGTFNGEDAFLGVGLVPAQKKGIMSIIRNLTPKIDNPNSGTHYISSWNGLGVYLFYLLWWVVIINFLVALMNMLPAGIFDGGRFFYLSVWALTGKEKIARNAYKTSTWALIAALFVLMIVWAKGLFF
jgi:membrane-associated protease RseP (regulator of RpoE activity)